MYGASSAVIAAPVHRAQIDAGLLRSQPTTFLSYSSPMSKRSTRRKAMLKDQSLALHYFEPFGRRVLYCGFGVFLTLVCIALGVYLLCMAPPLSNPLFVVGLVCGLLWCGAMLIAMSLRTRLTLTPRTLRWRKVFGTREVARSDITGYWTWYEPFRDNSTTYVFCMFEINVRQK